MKVTNSSFSEKIFKNLDSKNSPDIYISEREKEKSPDKMLENVICHHYNIGYFKYKNKFSKVHAKVDYPDQKCQNKKIWSKCKCIVKIKKEHKAEF